MPGFNIDPFAKSDPFAKADPLARLKIPGMDSGGAPMRRRADFRVPLPEDEQASFGKQVLGAGASGVSYVLGTLDKPGQAVRGLLAGKGVSSLKHLVPFSGAMGLTTDEDNTTGRDLTDKLGLTRKGDNGWGAWGTGLAADVLTDPLTYTTFGANHALTPVGKALQKTGALKGWSREALLQGFHATESGLAASGKAANEIAHMADKGLRIANPAMEALGAKANTPLSGLVRVGLPFGPGVTLGTGAKAQAVARGLDRAGRAVRFGNPIGRGFGYLFDSTSHNAVDALTQMGAQRFYDPALSSLKAEARNDLYGALEHLDPIIRDGIHPEQTITDAARAVAEGVPHRYDPTLAAQVGPLAQQIGDTNKRYLAEARAQGLPLQDVADQYANYVHRQALDVNHAALQLGGKKGPNKSRLYQVTSGSDIAREPVFRDIPGGTARINDWFDRFAGMKRKSEIQATAQTIRKELEDDLVAGGRAMDPKIATAFDKKAEDLAKRIGFANPRYRTTPATATDPAIPGLPFFTPDLAGDLAQRGQQHARTMAAAKGAIGTIGLAARKYVNDGTMISVPSLLKKIGLQTQHFDKATGTPAAGALIEAYRALAPKGAGMVDPLLTMGPKKLVKTVGKFGVTKEHAEQILRAYQGWKAPEQIKGPLAALDSATNAFKALAYPMWIPAHVRNAFTATLNNIRRGTRLGDYADQLKVMTGRGARDLGKIHPQFAALPEAERLAAIRRAQYSSANIFGGHGMSDEIAGARQVLEAGDGRFTPHVPGTDRSGRFNNVAKDTADLVLNQGLLGSLKATGQTAWNLATNPLDVLLPTRWGRLGQHFDPLAIKGVGGAAKDALPAVAAGRKAGTNIEDFFRGAQWIRELKNGSSPEMAAREINNLHFDYDALTQFEKNVMRRLVPFYTFARKNLPLQLETALTRPGIITSQYKPFSQPRQDGDNYVPQYLASGVAVPLGPEEDGKRQFISKLGLPAEEAFEKLHFQNGMPDIRKTAMDYLSMGNPLLKAPLEQLFDTQLHTQRRLSDLKAPRTASAIGRLFGEDNPQLLSQIMVNSPLTRFITSADKLTDPRKSLGQKLLNLGTGVRVTDVDVDKQRAVELRNALEEMMRGRPHLSTYNSFYVRPEDIPNLTPQEIQLMRAYSGMQDAARKYAKEKKRIGIRPGS